MVQKGPIHNSCFSFKTRTFAQKYKNKGMRFTFYPIFATNKGQNTQICVNNINKLGVLCNYLKNNYYLCTAILCAIEDFCSLMFAKKGGMYIT